jgi:hypothetical protein
VAVVTLSGSVTDPDRVWPVLIVLKSLLAPDGTIGTTSLGTPADADGDGGPVSLIASPASAGEARLAGRAGSNPPPAG